MVRVFCEHAPAFRFKAVYNPVRHAFTCTYCGLEISAELVAQFAAPEQALLAHSVLDVGAIDVIMGEGRVGIAVEHARTRDIVEDPWL